MRPDMRKLMVAVEGPIGVGKSILTATLCALFGFEPVFEPVETNPYLERFYKDMGRWSFSMQIHLLHARYLLHQRARFSRKSTITDRSIYGDVAFANILHADGLIQDLEYDTYRLAWEAMRQTLVYPDVCIFLTAPVPWLQDRIKEKRGREYESGISDEYLTALSREYDALFDEMSNYSSCQKFDWTDPNKNLPAVVDLIEKAGTTTGLNWARRAPLTI